MTSKKKNPVTYGGILPRLREWQEQQVLSRMERTLSEGSFSIDPHIVQTKKIWPVKALSDYTTPELVMEMLRRGYAVLKCPEPGAPPETLQPKED